jgi:hypothetical protein
MKLALHIRLPFGWHHRWGEMAHDTSRRHSLGRTKTEMPPPAPLAQPVVWILMIVTLALIAAAAYLLWAKVSSVWPFL